MPNKIHSPSKFKTEESTSLKICAPRPTEKPTDTDGIRLVSVEVSDEKGFRRKFEFPSGPVLFSVGLSDIFRRQSTESLCPSELAIIFVVSYR